MIKKIDAAILCGGFGTRLKSLSGNTPKSLMPISEKKLFIDLLIDKIVKTKIFSNIFLCTHYRKKLFEKYIKKNKAKLFISQEHIPLGTSGALINLEKKKKFLNDNILVINGDTSSDIDLYDFTKNFFLTKKNLMAFSFVKNADRYGKYKIIGNKIIREIKKNKNSGWINNGYYILKKKDICKFSYFSNLEKQLFEKTNFNNNLSPYKVVNDKFVDIGTTSDYLKFKNEK
jgi:D-glycero-alpha-D-manno-heptose 1-phosphate guanylyltransferase